MSNDNKGVEFCWVNCRLQRVLQWVYMLRVFCSAGDPVHSQTTFFFASFTRYGLSFAPCGIWRWVIYIENRGIGSFVMKGGYLKRHVGKLNRCPVLNPDDRFPVFCAAHHARSFQRPCGIVPIESMTLNNEMNRVTVDCVLEKIGSLWHFSLNKHLLFNSNCEGFCV